ncbi:MAG: PRC-barrel domain-containing protein [Solirubrobacterales bacterium]|nr:PRC-barrel domain-containing protein [Solirubrobacterales bacterium]
MTSAVEDLSDLPGKKVLDQVGQEIGEVKEIYAQGGDGHPTWVSVDAKTGGIGQKQQVFIPLARLKQEGEDVTVPYSAEHIENAPEIEGGDEISEEDDRKLRDYYAIDLADQELRSDNKSYVTLVPDEGGASSKVDDTDNLETPDEDKRSDETKERVKDPGSSEIRDVTFEG